MSPASAPHPTPPHPTDAESAVSTFLPQTPEEGRKAQGSWLEQTHTCFR